MRHVVNFKQGNSRERLSICYAYLFVFNDVLFLSVLLLAYMNGNGSLCRALVRAGSPLGEVNKQGLSVFNAPVATKQLLFKLLGKLDVAYCKCNLS